MGAGDATAEGADVGRGRAVERDAGARGQADDSVSVGPIAGQQLSFHAVPENWAEGMNYCAVPVPAAITAALGTTGPVLVMAHVNESKPFRVSLFPVGGGQHYLRIKAKVRQETGTTTGDRICVRFTVLDRAQVEIPDDLRRALATHAVTEPHS